MRNQTNWAKGILTWGVVLAVLGIALAAAGLLLPDVAGKLGLNEKLIPAAGIVLLVLGLVSLLQYAFARSDPKVGQQMMIQERDERL